ncbi:MAG: hypothetical protein GY759_14180 [Chloroflexi bacterium]|nr:hypothetical protein [Chloroflexota bacterium]
MLEKNVVSNDMVDEYDFSNGVRGKHHKTFREGYSVNIYHADGTQTIKEFAPEPDMVKLEPDVRDYFPDSESANAALRGLISLIPEKSSAAE